MDCPVCAKPMARGALSIEHTALGFLAAGLGHLELFFREAGARRRSILSPGQQSASWRCKACGTTVLLGA